MSDAMKYNFAGIEGAASASVDDGNVDSFAGTGDEGQTVQKLAGIWGGSGSDAYQQTQQNWQTTAAEIEGSSAGEATGDMDSFLFEDSSSGAIVAGWDILKQAPFSGSGVEGRDDLVLEDSSSEERSGVQYQQAADDAASSIGSMGFCKDAFDFKAMEAGEGLGKPNPGKMNFEHYFDNSSAFDGDGIDDLATYQPDTAIIGPGESFTYTLDPREVGAIIMEYAVML